MMTQKVNWKDKSIEAKFASFIETIEISALKSMQLNQAIDSAIESAKSSMQDVPTSKISSLIENLTETKPPPYIQGDGSSLSSRHR